MVILSKSYLSSYSLASQNHTSCPVSLSTVGGCYADSYALVAECTQQKHSGIIYEILIKPD